MARSPSRHILRWILLGLAGFVVLVGVVAGYEIATFNPNRLKPRLIAEIRALTGRTLALHGPLRLRLSLHPTIEATDVTLSNPPGFSRPEMMQLGALDLGLDLTGLMRGQVAISRLTLVKPDLLLERTRTGAVNWHFAPAQPAAAAAAPGTAPAAAPRGGMRFSLFVRQIRVTDATLGYRDDATGKQTTIALPALSLSEATPTAPLKLTANGTVNAVPVAVTLRTAALAALLAGDAAPVVARLTAAGASLALDGTIAKPLTGAGIALAVKAAVPDLAALGPLAGGALPPLRGLALAAEVSVPGTLAQGGQMRNLVLTTPAGVVSGALSVRLAAVPMLAGTLTSPSLDADKLLAALHGTQAAAPAGPPAGHPAGAPGPAASPARYVIPTTKLPVAALRSADVDLHVAVAALRTGGETWHSLAFHLVLQGGHLTVAPFTATPPAGPLAGALTLNAAVAAPPVSLRLHAPGLALASLLKLAGEPGLATGDMALDIDVHGAGASPHAIAAGLTGTVVATMQGGTIDNKVVNKLFGAMLARANLAGLLAHGGQSRIACFAARLTARNGAAQLAPFLFASSLNTIDGGGAMNLGAETLDLTFRPQARAGGTGIAVPVHVGGTFASPAVGLSQGAMAQAGVGVVLGLLAGQKLAVPQGLQATPPDCATALAQARSGAAPAAAAAPGPAPAAQPVNPGTLLQRLFH